MEYLVTMTTHVPEGTSQAEVDDIRTREAANSFKLAERGQLLRLWRPPLQPGEWRTLGLFAAPDAARLEDVLSSMPLRVWRSDEVTPLTPHPNDPGPAYGASGAAKEFLVAFAPAALQDTTSQALRDASAAEAVSAKALAGQGHLMRLWRTPGEGHALGLWRARDAAEMQTVLDSLPLAPWLSMETTPLSEHPSDPGPVRS
ncbi:MULTISPECIES: muconolactone Delta-isomerase family protein [unclassified Streptomyces]|uniref:muconolactone Delta-isomerase family protein n=1 Tax=unclassified Streptomyces TaxID=2593676 RepID=UPI002E34475D|nr:MULTISPECIES: muconolactone Delta-isomerase family protein [unclassified Streptomyces]